MSKKKVFRYILISIPLAIIILELFLRFFDYGFDPASVTVAQLNGKDFYTINQAVGKKFFEQNRPYYTKGTHDFFEIEKSPNTVRIFCFGASTTAGFPYEYNIIPAEILREQLAQALPDKKIEVINTAIAATNSYAVSDLVNDLFSYEPDLFIVYMGQNEFYGALGTNSTISAGGQRWLVKTYLWMQQFKTFQLIRNTLHSISGIFNSFSDEDDEILLEKMIGNKSIEYRGDDYIAAKNIFTENYAEVIEAAKKNNIPILLSTLVTNEKDVVPYVSYHSEKIDNSSKSEWDKYYHQGLALLEKEEYNKAIEVFHKAESLDSSYAELIYRLGECYMGLGNYVKAKQYFLQAVDLDGLRLRAPSEFNNIITKLAGQFDVPLADINKAFQDNSEYNIIGDELLIDHVHPNMKGYFLLSNTWFKAILNNKLLGIKPGIELNDSLFWKEYPKTELDGNIGEVKVFKLMSMPPFVPDSISYTIYPDNFIEKVAYDYAIDHSISWMEAHMQVSKEYLKQNDKANMLKEFRAMLSVDENNEQVITFIGDLYANMQLYSEAKSWYEKAWQLNKSKYSQYRLGVMKLDLNKPDEAIAFLEACLSDNNYSFEQDFSTGEIEDIQFNLAKAYYEVKEYKKAEKYLEVLTKKNPNNVKAKELLNKVSSITE